jgi:hypothetical protein
MSYENEELTELLVVKSDDLALETALPQLQANPRLQYIYLHTFFKLKQDQFNNERLSTGMPRYEHYHDRLVELIVDHGTEEELIDFLKSSNFRKPENALRRCETRTVLDPSTHKKVDKPFYNAMVYILGDLGRTKEALEKIFETGNVENAIEFVMSQRQGVGSCSDAHNKARQETRQD